MELENIEEESVAEIPVESEKEESDEENEEQLEPLRQSQRIKKPPVRYGIDEFTNTANAAITKQQRLKNRKPSMMSSIVIILKNGKLQLILNTAL